MAKLGTVLITAASVKGTSAALAFMKDAGCTLRLETSPIPVDEQWLIERAKDADGLLFAMEPVTSRLLEAATRLRIIACPAVRYDTVDIAAATRRVSR